MAEKILTSEEDEARVAELRERLTFLQTMANTTLNAKVNEIIHGQEGDLKIHGRTIVEVHKRVEIKHEDEAKSLDEAVDSVMTDGLKGVFSDWVKGAIGGVVKTAIATSAMIPSERSNRMTWSWCGTITPSCESTTTSGATTFPTRKSWSTLTASSPTWS